MPNTQAELVKCKRDFSTSQHSQIQPRSGLFFSSFCEWRETQIVRPESKPYTTQVVTLATDWSCNRHYCYLCERSAFLCPFFLPYQFQEMLLSSFQVYLFISMCHVKGICDNTYEFKWILMPLTLNARSIENNKDIEKKINCIK